MEFENSDDLKYLGYEIEMTVSIREDGQVLIKKIFETNIEQEINIF